MHYKLFQLLVVAQFKLPQIYWHQTIIPFLFGVRVITDHLFRSIMDIILHSGAASLSFNSELPFSEQATKCMKISSTSNHPIFYRPVMPRTMPRVFVHEFIVRDFSSTVTSSMYCSSAWRWASCTKTLSEKSKNPHAIRLLPQCDLHNGKSLSNVFSIDNNYAVLQCWHDERAYESLYSSAKFLAALHVHYKILTLVGAPTLTTTCDHI